MGDARGGARCRVMKQQGRRKMPSPKRIFLEESSSFFMANVKAKDEKPRKAKDGRSLLLCHGAMSCVVPTRKKPHQTPKHKDKDKASISLRLLIDSLVPFLESLV